MPILAREPDLHPAELFAREELGRESTARWWLLCTLSRREKDLMRRLRALDIAFYAPLISRRSRSPSGRWRTAYVPLYPGYVFLYGNEQHRYQAFTSNCVARCLEVPDGGELTGDLRQTHRLIESGVPLTPESRLEAGMTVRIRSGPLAGVVGTVLKRAEKDRLLVAVRFIGEGVSVLLEDYQFEKLE